ncbi:MAG: M20/M25/M40 family metallo-hydrolase [Bacteroidota bacterium]|nr:M20/M25/M40 family metallo-hydrolase [Bacteroidota bacterium]
MRLFLFIVFIIFNVHVQAQQLSGEEKKIISYINQNLPQTLQLLEEIVNINSGTHNTEGVRQVGNRLRTEFDKIGFTTEWVELPDSLQRAGHLVASIKGTKGKKLFLIGHLDTVFEPDMPANPFRMLTDSTVTGQGVNDMKGGDVIVLAALQALYAAGVLNDVSITAYFTGDEEDAGVPRAVSRGDFITRGQQHDIALGFETAQGLHTVATGRRGSSQWQLTVTGQQGHSAGVFANGYGAIYEAARIINQFRVDLSRERYLTFNPGIFLGGSEVLHDSSAIRGTVAGKLNIIAPRAIVQGDLRFLSEGQKQAARARMQHIVQVSNLKGTRASISFADGIPAMEPTAGNERLVQVLNKVTKDLGFGETKSGDPGSRGAGDISYIAKYVDCIDGLGASGQGAHAPGEIIYLKEFPKLIQRAALLLYRLTR